MAILEFTSSNGYSFFTINFECRDISIIDTEHAIFSHFSNFFYAVVDGYTGVLGNSFATNGWPKIDCEKNGYEKYDLESIPTNHPG